MIDKHFAPRILFPRTVNEALEMANSEPAAVYWAGGTLLAGSSGDSKLLNLPKTVISLGLVEELARASRTEHNLEIGSMMSLDRLASIGKSALPVALPEALSGIGNRPLRCRATMGGHLANPNGSGDLRPLLQILDAAVETRYLRERQRRRKPVPASRKLPAARLESGSGLHKGEIITKITIPTHNWNFGDYCKIYPASGSDRKIVFSAVARVEKGVLVEWCLALAAGTGAVVRDRELEIAVAGKPLPLTPKELNSVEESIMETAAGAGLDEYGRLVTGNLARTFLRRAAG